MDIYRKQTPHVYEWGRPTRTLCPRVRVECPRCVRVGESPRAGSVMLCLSPMTTVTDGARSSSTRRSLTTWRRARPCRRGYRSWDDPDSPFFIGHQAAFERGRRWGSRRSPDLTARGLENGEVCDHQISLSGIAPDGSVRWVPSPGVPIGHRRRASRTSLGAGGAPRSRRTRARARVPRFQCVGAADYPPRRNRADHRRGGSWRTSPPDGRLPVCAANRHIGSQPPRASPGRHRCTSPRSASRAQP